MGELDRREEDRAGKIIKGLDRRIGGIRKKGWQKEGEGKMRDE